MTETRHYIGLLGGLHIAFTCGPGTPEQFRTGPHDPVSLGETTTYPVSEEIAAEWVRDDQ